MNPATCCAAVLVDELVRHSVREAVLCPGSRSAPLAFALQAADAAGRLRLHVRTDERTAAFLALGLAKASGHAVPVVTTSGTAVASLHPAVLEAAHSGIPLLLLTADRPPELRGTGANQTTQQVGIFRDVVRWQHDLATPDERIGQVAVWRATASRAVIAAQGDRDGTPGPVHLNLPFREPLVPDAAAPEVAADGRPDGAPWTSARLQSVAAEPIEDDGRRTLVLVGDLPLAGPDWGSAAAEVARARGWPVVAEPSSGGARTSSIPHGSLLLGSADWMSRHRPERVVVVGRPTLTRAVSRLLAQPHVDVDLVAAAGPWPDPASRVRSVLPMASLQPVTGRHHRDSKWLRAWQDAGAAVAQAVSPVIEQSWPSGLGVAKTMLARLDASAQLFVGSSNPVRDLDLAGVTSGPRVVASRGLAGIDGCVSTSIGLALASPAPTYALLGDLTFLHDVTGLVVGPQEPQPDLTIVVVNDDGGGIFATLEPGAPAHADAFDRVFGTPHGADLAGFCEGAGVEHVTADSAEELAAEVGAWPTGLRVVEVRIDRSAHRRLREQLAETTVQALSRL
ncbi:2-succinyl-5-enolpyruvyl-6-hydroxy-3-cyclohexene-1-carboxylic-acid synthase [Angustibacter sp. McL0619]|uniref:2-succinyl-5-enolpyruvyl-6-hydroxy-3- cyclohexene-1-carboxylic-acid synthase n=1 Tax=Angustibacter sp. McL0619 TaxID=3415676 RepID=UPI003CF3D39C